MNVESHLLMELWVVRSCVYVIELLHNCRSLREICYAARDDCII